MTIVNTTDFAENGSLLSQAISAYADAARDDAALIISSGVAAADARVTDAGEGFTGVIRWLNYSEGSDAAKPSANATLSTSLVDANYMSAGSMAETYVKNASMVAAKENSIQSLISKVDGLAFLGRQFGAVRARREDGNLRNVLLGIALENYAEVGSALAVDADGGRIGTSFAYRTGGASTAATYKELFKTENTQNNRSSFFDTLLDAMTAVSGEFEEAYYYLVVSPTTFNTLRKQNVLDVNPVQDGNLNINTLLGGKIRLIVSGNASFGATSTTFVDSDNANPLVSFLIKPAALHYSNVVVNNPTAIDNNVITNAGFGDVAIVSRWSNIIHPKGYSWNKTDAFPTDTMLADADNWDTRATNVNQTGIFPIFHS